MASRKGTERLSKILNSVYTDRKFLSELCNLANNNFNAVVFALGDILEYYITSRDVRVLKLEEMNVVVGLFKYLGTNKDYPVYNSRDTENPFKSIRRNVIKNGYMTRSINTYFLKSLASKGLGNPKALDSKVNKHLENLEAVFGKNSYSDDPLFYNSSFCMSAPGANSFYYASSNAPKRLFLGILGQKPDSLLPLMAGESKISYFKRVLDKKLSYIDSSKDLMKKARKSGEKLIKMFCKNRPSLMLIPINSEEYSLKVTKSINDTYDIAPINDWIFLKIMNDNPMKFFARDLGEANGELGNIISVNTIVPYKELGIVSVPDRYEIMQIIAKNKGYKKRTMFSYLTGEIVYQDSFSTNENGFSIDDNDILDNSNLNVAEPISILDENQEIDPNVETLQVTQIQDQEIPIEEIQEESNSNIETTSINETQTQDNKSNTTESIETIDFESK